MSIANLIFGHFIGKSLAVATSEIEDQKEKQKRKDVLDEVEDIIFQLYSTKQPITTKVVAEKWKLKVEKLFHILISFRLNRSFGNRLRKKWMKGFIIHGSLFGLNKNKRK